MPLPVLMNICLKHPIGTSGFGASFLSDISVSKSESIRTLPSSCICFNKTKPGHQVPTVANLLHVQFYHKYDDSAHLCVTAGMSEKRHLPARL